jgi:CubicO group peptidase (beta-lactamase class C family)
MEMLMQKPQRIALAILLSVAGSKPVRAGAVDAYVKAQMQKLRIPGLSIAVVKNDKIIKAAGYGLANVETNTPATPETVYKIASLSKQFIAAAIMLLVQEHKLRLDEKVSEYLDDPPQSWKDITIRDLLTHTSGMPRDPAEYYPYSEHTLTEVIKSTYPMPLLFRPGEKWLYSNVGYYVLAEIIGKVSGEPWAKYISERLFVPAGMTSTRTTTNAIVPHRAAGYDRIDGRITNAENWIAVRPSGAFLSTVLDLANWDIFMDLHGPLSSSNQKLMRMPVTLNDGTSADYGFGWYVDSFLGRARIHHDGQFPGFRSDYERFIDDKLSVIILANSGDSSVESLALKVAGFYAPALKTPPFAVNVNLSNQTVKSGDKVTIDFAVKDRGKAAPRSVVEMEIWDVSNKPVNKQHKSNQDFKAGETRNYSFPWIPPKPGKYTISLGVYGLKWAPSYSWNQGMTILTVN